MIREVRFPQAAKYTKKKKKKLEKIQQSTQIKKGNN